MDCDTLIPHPAKTHPSIAVIRSLGGDYARVDRRGKYRLRVTTPDATTC